MATKKMMWSFIILLVAWFWPMEFATPVSAETLKFKSYTYVTKAESFPVGDVDGHTVGFTIRRAFLVFENGEVATQKSVSTSDAIKGSGASLTYQNITFSDGSTIIIKAVGAVTGTDPMVYTAIKMTREIIKGTGRFAGIKGTGTTTVKYFPVEEGEAGPRGIGEGTLTYTLPPK